MFFFDTFKFIEILPFIRQSSHFMFQDTLAFNHTLKIISRYDSGYKNICFE